MEDLKLNSINELVSWTYGTTFFKNKIASLARTVCRTAEEGDEMSRKILEEAALEAVNSVSVVAEKLDFAAREFDLVFVGTIRCLWRYL